MVPNKEPDAGNITGSEETTLNQNIEEQEASQMSRNGTRGRFSIIDEIIFYGLIVLSLIGVFILQASMPTGRLFWLIMIPIIGIATIYIELTKSREEGIKWGRLVRTQILHWGSLLVAIELLSLLIQFGRITQTGVSLMTLLLLAQTTFLVGVYVDWRFGVVAVFQVFCLIGLAYLEAYLWVMLAVAGAIILLGIYFHRKFPQKSPARGRYSSY